MSPTTEQFCPPVVNPVKLTYYYYLRVLAPDARELVVWFRTHSYGVYAIINP